MKTESLGGSASRGAAVTAVGQVARVGVQMVSLVVLARLLGPSDYGLVAMVTAIVGIGEVFRDFGLSSASIQAKNVSVGQRSNLFWVNTSIGFALALVAVACSPLVASLYGDEAVSAVMAASALTFVFNGLATQHRADLNRRMKFGTLAVVDTAAQALAVAVAIGLAAGGAGYWALVAMTVSQAILSMTGVVVMARWVPKGYSRNEEMRQFFRFGAGMVGTQLLGYASKNVDSIVLGVTAGPVAVGFYDRAYRVLVLPLNQFQAPSTRVALPVLSRLNDEAVRYKAFLLRGQTIVLHPIAIILALSAAQAQPLFDIVLGPQWRESVPIFQALAVGGLASMASYACHWVFLSKGLTVSYFWFSLITRPIVVVAIIVGAVLGGPLGVALAFSIVNLALWPATLWWLHRASDAPVVDMLTNGLRAFLVYAVAAAASWLGTFAVPAGTWPPIVALGIGVLIFFLALGIFFLCLPAYRRDVRAILDTRRFLRLGRA